MFDAPQLYAKTPPFVISGEANELSLFVISSAGARSAPESRHLDFAPLDFAPLDFAPSALRSR